MVDSLPLRVKECIGRNLYVQKWHPLCLIKEYIYKYPLFNDFTKFDDLEPIVDIYNNFDALLIPADHVSRSKSDTYYISDNVVMRTQTSAHQNQLLKLGHKKFLVTGDVYRKDEVDRTHYPVFHQMECVNVVNDDVDAELDLKHTLSGLIEYLFPNCEYRFSAATFGQ